MKFKKIFKWYFVVPAAIILMIVLSFLFWFIKPSQQLNIAVIDKTVPATAADGESYLGDVENNFRKHLGSNWITDYLKIKNPKTDKLYDFTSDYYGNKIDEEGNVTETDSILDMSTAPDLLYLADTYGVEDDENKGINKDEMNTISYCNTMGSTIVGEQDILTTGTDSNISSQLQSLFGISATGWVGRYIYDLADLSDVPYWAPDMYLEKYGVEWRCSGSGILLVSGDGDILVLEESKDFKSKNLLKIAVTDDYDHEFGSNTVNYYNWFELITAEKGTDIVAEYTFNLNSTGMEKFEPVSSSPVFAAVTRTSTKYGGVNYYFAGDFNDFVTQTKPYRFIGADLLYRLISFDKEGDVTNFYWNFYEPMMKQIMKNCLDTAEQNDDTDSKDKKTTPARISNDSFEVKVDGNWQKLTLKGFNVNGEAPGDKKYHYSSDVSYFEELIDKAAQMGANCIRAYDLYSPEFYRALYEYNSDSENSTIYLIQEINTPTDVDRNNITDNIKELKQNIEETIKALHGNGVKIDDFGERKSGTYSFDVSNYVLSYIIDADLNKSETKKLLEQTSTYSGTYFSSGANSVEALYAKLCDYAVSYNKDKYKTINIVFAQGDTDFLTDAIWVDKNTKTYNLSNIITGKDTVNYFGVSYKAHKYDNAVLNYASKLTNGYDDAFDGYLHNIRSMTSKPVLIDAFGASTTANSYDKYSEIYGLSESDQANQIIEMHTQIIENDMLGGLIADLNDSWVNLSNDSYKYTVPKQNASLWHDETDLNQTTGVLSVEPEDPDEIGLEFSATDERMQSMQLYTNASYLYFTITLDTEVDYDKEEMIVGIDTYQRNDGEYYYDKAYFANSLSGMEYVVKFESKKAASLYCVPSYSRTNKSVTSSEKYNGKFTFVSALNYGSFSASNTQFYMTGTTAHLRIPWAMMNITDPSQRIVIDDNSGSYIKTGQFKTTITSGLIASLLIGTKGTKDTAYIFPETKESAGYKTYKWAKWEAVSYKINEKEAVSRLKVYFSTF